jgi:hypothetical protein
MTKGMFPKSLKKVKADIAAILQYNIVNVLDHGLKNTGSTLDAENNTDYLQGIMDEYDTEYSNPGDDDGGGGGLHLYFPPGLYYINDTIYRSGFVTIWGAGSDRTVIYLVDDVDTTGDAMFEFGKRNSSESSRCTINGIKIEMSRTEHVKAIDNIRWYNRMRHSYLIDVRCLGATGRGFMYTYDAGYDRAQNLYFRDCAFEHSLKEGAYLYYPYYNINFDHCYFGATYGEAASCEAKLYIEASSQIRVHDCWFLEGASKAAAHIRLSQDVIFHDNNMRMTGVTLRGVFIDTCGNAILHDNTVGRSPTNETSYPNNAIDVSGSHETIVHGNIIRGYNANAIALGLGTSVFQHNNYDMVTGALVPDPE